jgi:hypothetical protein
MMVATQLNPERTMRKSSVSRLFELAEADIQKAAYYLWMENGCPAGRDLDYWLAAKELLRHRHRHGHASGPPHRRTALPFAFPTAHQPLANN